MRGRLVICTVNWQRRESLPPTPQLCERRVDQIEVRCVWYLIERGLPYIKATMLFRRGVFATCRATMMRAFRAHNGSHRSHLIDKPSVGKKDILLVEVATMIMGCLMGMEGGCNDFRTWLRAHDHPPRPRGSSDCIRE